MNTTIKKLKKHVLEISVISLAVILLLVSVVPGYVLAGNEGVSLREKKATALKIEAIQNVNLDMACCQKLDLQILFRTA